MRPRERRIDDSTRARSACADGDAICVGEQVAQVAFVNTPGIQKENGHIRRVRERDQVLVMQRHDTARGDRFQIAVNAPVFAA